MTPNGLSTSRMPVSLSLSHTYKHIQKHNFKLNPGGSTVKESAYSAGGVGPIPGLETSPGEGNGNPLQYSCLENSIDRGAWQSMGLQKSDRI